MRIHALDILRILACLMVVTMHAPLPASESDGMFLSALSYLTSPGIGLFFLFLERFFFSIRILSR